MNVDRLEEDESYFPAITPLIDVVLLVLIFFIVTATYAEVPDELDLTLPEAATADTESMAEANLFITEDGRYRFEGSWYEEDELPGVFRSYREDARRTVLLISADARSNHQYVVTALGAARQAGIDDVGFEILVPDQGTTP